MKRIALLATGGTIASLASENGLAPAINGEQLLHYCPRIKQNYEIIVRDVFSLDSSNIQPEEWQILAWHVKEVADEVDGMVITHGTDTMAYTAAALSFLLLSIEKPVVLTGSQLSIAAPFSDAPGNFEEAFIAAANLPAGVYIAFHHQIILGTRAVKMRTLSFDAFASINASPVGYFDAEGLHLSIPKETQTVPHPKALGDSLDSRVFLLKLVPGTNPEIFNHLIEADYQGLVLEGFGLGGLHYIRRNLVDSMKRLSQKGIITLVTTQCMFEKADFSIYEVGHGFLNLPHVYGAHDMTSEAAVAKLMWVLGDRENRLEYLRTPLCYEMMV